MTLPDFYLERPAGPDEATAAAFGRLWRSHLSAGGGPLDYPLAAPRWQFLCWLADTQDVLLHGSGSPNVTKLEPRKSDDVGEFGARIAVYAASDGLWAMYFAVVDRRQVSSLVKACIRLPTSDASRPRTYYYGRPGSPARGDGVAVRLRLRAAPGRLRTGTRRARLRIASGRYPVGERRGHPSCSPAARAADRLPAAASSTWPRPSNRRRARSSETGRLPLVGSRVATDARQRIHPLTGHAARCAVGPMSGCRLTGHY
jgi:hypothetical protein